MATLTGGQLVAKQLKKEGVECVFALSGGHIMDIIYGCREEGIEVYMVRHEDTAGFAADAYARVSGKPGVIITTAGPGVTNAATAMGEAKEACTPLVHIGGGAMMATYDSGTCQDLNTLDCMAAVCKDAKRCLTTERLPDYVSKAFRTAVSGTPGPVYLEIPMNVVGASVETDSVRVPQHPRTTCDVYGDPRYIAEAAELLAKAKRPVMVIGEAARYATNHGDYVEKLANYLNMPVYTTSMPYVRGLFADEGTNELFHLGEAAAAEADVILELGVYNHNHLNRGQAPVFHADAKVIQIHEDRTMIGFNRDADVGIVASSGVGAMQLYAAVKGLVPAREDGVWVDRARELTAVAMKPFTDARVDAITKPMHIGRLTWELRQWLEANGRDWHIICDGGDTAQWVQYNNTAHYPGQMLRFGINGTIGMGPGFSLGAWAADKRPVMYVTGDGSFGFHAMDMETLLRYKVPVICVIANDSAWGMIKLSQELKHPEYLAKHGHHPINLLPHMFPYEKMVAIWDGKGMMLDKVEDVIPALDEIKASGTIGILNVEVNQHTPSPRTIGFAGVVKKA